MKKSDRPQSATAATDLTSHSDVATETIGGHKEDRHQSSFVLSTTSLRPVRQTDGLPWRAFLNRFSFRSSGFRSCLTGPDLVMIDIPFYSA